MNAGAPRGSPADRTEEYFAHERAETFALLPVEGVRRVLSLGCAEGRTEERLKRERNLEQVVGVEFEEEIAERARARLDAVHSGDIESLELPYPPGHFDAALCLDVLEHLVDPWKVLRSRVLPAVRPGGWVLVSVPNVQFWPVIWRLCRGQWVYARQGVMDVGHLRFFTVRSARDLLERTGFRVVRVERKYRLWEARGDREAPAAVSGAARRLGPTAWLKRLGFFHVFFFLRGYFTYQTLVLARRPGGPGDAEAP